MNKKFTFFLALAMFLVVALQAQHRAATVDGLCFLEGQTNHSGIKVLFTAVSPSAVTTEVFTDFGGAFTAGLAEGIYTVEYSKSGYVTQTLPGTFSFFVNTTLDDITLQPGFSGTLEVSGPQSGTWESNYLVKAMGNLTVAAGDTLIIEPGVTVQFMGFYKLEIFGTLLATGAEGDSIVFTSGHPTPVPNDWQTIHFQNASSSGSIVSNAKVQYGQTGIYCQSNASPMIINCLIQFNTGYGISCFGVSSPTIQNNTISNNNSSGIYCSFSSPTIQNNNISNSNGNGIYCFSSSPNIQNNIFSNNNSSGIYVIYDSSPNIQNNYIKNNFRGILYSSNLLSNIISNLIINNDQEGIYCSSSAIIQKNTICQNNVAGLRTDSNSNPDVYNNIFVGNTRGVQLFGAPSTLTNNLFWDNTTLSEGSAVPASFGEIVTQNANGDPCDTYFNLFMDPEFVDNANGNFNLLVTSPCIDAGNPNQAYYDPDGTIADIGAYYFDQGSAAPVISDFTADPVSGRQPLVVQFTNDITGPVTEYTWSFGDGTTSNQPNPAHVYTSMGTYDVSLLVTGPGGSDTKVKANYITVNAPLPPLVAKFTAAPLLGYAPLEVQFSNQSTGPWQTVLWDFGDGNTSTVSNPLHTYQEPGYYSVSLTITTLSTSKTEFKENYIHAIAPQEVVALFEVSGNYGAAPYTVAFFDQSFGSVDSLLWDFGDGAASTLANPMHTFELPGEYVVSLTAFGLLNEDTSTETILVEAKAPVITQIVDRPDDQGGYVYIYFKKSFYDQVVPNKSTESYTIQRQDNGMWVTVQSSAAYGEPFYVVEAATLKDSTAQSPSISNFRVIASMTEGTWISEPAQGYSVDNIAPQSPAGLDYLLAENQIEFWWNPSPDHDFNYFAVYRSEESGAFPSQPFTTLTGNSFSDAITPDDAYFYIVTAFDYAGNESLPSEEISNLDRMDMVIPEGWSGISGYMQPYNTAIESMFAPVTGELVILSNESGMYWPGQNVNTLINWQSDQGYQIKMTQQSDFTIRGFGLSDRTLTLDAGWTLMPVLSEFNADVIELFATTGLEIVKEVAGYRLYWPQYGINTLGYLSPGKAYQVRMNSPASIVFPTEPMKSGAVNQPEPVNIAPWNITPTTPASHAIAFESDACSNFQPLDMIGVFTPDGLCAGLQQFSSSTLGVVAFANDQLTAEKDGFDQGEPLVFRLFRPETGELFDLEVTYDAKFNTGQFTTDGMSVVKTAKLAATAIGSQHQAAISIFPNPTKGSFTIGGLAGNFNLQVFNATGLKIKDTAIELPGQVDLSGYANGIYFIRIANGERSWVEKVVRE